MYSHSYLFPPVLGLVERFASARRLSVLEIGCGNGDLASRLAGAGHAVTGTDTSASGIRIARQAAPQVSFVECSVYDGDFETVVGGPFDLVVALEVIEHLVLPRELMRCASRVLKPGGRLILSTPYHGFWKNLAISLVNGWDRHFGVWWDGGHVKFFSPATLTSMSEEEGFRRNACTGVGRLPLFWKSMIFVASKVEPPTGH